MTDSKKPYILIGTPAYGNQLNYQYVSSLIVLLDNLKRVGIKYSVVFVGNESLITRARTIIVGKFLSNPDFTHLFFIDADIEFTWENFGHLWNSRKDVVAGIYPSKTFEFENVKKYINIAQPKEIKSLCLNYMINYNRDSGGIITEPILGKKNKLIKLDYCTTGFLLMKRSAIELMKEKYPELSFYNEQLLKQWNIKKGNLVLIFDTMVHPEKNDYLSEDYAMCYRWRKLGGEVWGLADSKITHHGCYKFEGNLQTFFKYQK